MVVPGFPRSVHGYLTDDRRGPGQVHVMAVGIAHDVPSQQCVPKVGVQFYLLLTRPALDIDPAEFFVPRSIGGIPCGVKIPARELRFQVLAGVLHAGIGNGYFQEHIFAFSGGETDGQSGVLPRNAGGLDGTQDFPFPPADGLRRRLGKLCPEIDWRVLGPATGSSHDFPSCDGVVVDHPDFRIGRGPMGQESAGVEQDITFFALRVSVPVESYARGRREFGRDAVVVQMDSVVARLGDFTFMLERGLVCVHPLMPPEGPRHGHDSHAGHLPVVNVAEAADMQGIIQIPGAPGMGGPSVGTQAHHAEREAGRIEEEPAGPVGVHEGIDLVHIGFLRGSQDGPEKGQEERERFFHVNGFGRNPASGCRPRTLPPSRRTGRAPR